MTPRDDGIPLLIVTLTLLFLSLVVVTLRCVVRYYIKAFGRDDWLMLFAEFFFVGTCIDVIEGCFGGLGSLDTHLKSPQDVNRVKHYVMVFQCFYCISLIFIKTSICSAFLRLTISRAIKACTWIVMLTSIVAAVTTLMVVLLQCMPLQATWDPSAGHCASTHLIVNFSIFISTTSILTDFSCVLLPAIMLFGLQMRTTMKITISLIMGLGFVASSATIVRLLYFNAYTATTDYACKVSKIVIWSMVESGLGIIAGSAPALRSLLHIFPVFGKTERKDNPRLAQDRIHGLVTIGSARTRGIALAQVASHDREDDESAERVERQSDNDILVTSEFVVDQYASGEEVKYPNRTFSLGWDHEWQS